MVSKVGAQQNETLAGGIKCEEGIQPTSKSHGLRRLARLSK